MPILLYAIAALEIAGGVVVFGGAASAIHEILGALLGGFAFLTVGLAAILQELERINRTMKLAPGVRAR